ncbi:hypothetical protein VN97_g12141 [Penicillium thymicola]|uniref:Uncharacterized protein n=2 Tax=Penicillium thymicola TaxID=293382 RepID=A0AAI9T6V8_PENTH|nr:hypothetical protein VN97_g12141 [Penicillium thymicola]
MSQDVEIFAKDILLENEASASRKPAAIVHLIRLYALNAWFDRLQTLKDQLGDLSLQSLSHRDTQHNEEPEDLDEGNHAVDGPINEDGMKSAILRYTSSLDVECQRLKLDLRAAKIESSTNGFDCTKKKKTYNSEDSLVVTHPTTNSPACGLSTAERTGSPIFHTLWSYVLV